MKLKDGISLQDLYIAREIERAVMQTGQKFEIKNKEDEKAINSILSKAFERHKILSYEIHKRIEDMWEME